MAVAILTLCPIDSFDRLLQFTLTKAFFAILPRIQPEMAATPDFAGKSGLVNGEAVVDKLLQEAIAGAFLYIFKNIPELRSPSFMLRLSDGDFGDRMDLFRPVADNLDPMYGLDLAPELIIPRCEVGLDFIS